MKDPVRIKLIPILVIDDEPDYCEQLKADGLKFNFNITHYQNFEDGFEALEKNKKLKALILDGKCPLNKYQQPGTGKSNFVFHSINRLHHLELEDNRYIPYCINTYYPDQFSEDLEGITKVFAKKQDHQAMFEFIGKKIEELDETQLKHKYDDVFLFINNYFDEDDEDLFLELLIHGEDKDATNVISNLGIIRRLEEKLFDVIAVNYLKTEPEQFKRNRLGRTKGIIFHLKNNQILPKYLYNFSMDLYNIPSKYGNHNPLSNTQINTQLPNNYTVISLTHSLMQIMCWANGLIDNSVK